MGGEQSRESGGGVGVGGGGGLGGGGGGGVGEGRRGSESPRPSSTSPRPSISSDADLPYISYTVNRPIGDSPKATPKGVRVLKGSPRRRRRSPRPQEVVVVREANTSNVVDPELARLQSIPTFLPIMRSALTAPSARDPEILERLDTGGLLALARRYQHHLHLNAVVAAETQDRLTQRIRDVDAQVNEIVSNLMERQKTYARHAEKLNKVTEVSHALTRCHATLNLILESLDALNNSLPIEDRLEPFVWTTG
ncbi:BLOC-1 related complex subunit 5 [Oratosquilla oratoria]|uniref:BLOC-1 related complex subunit 5 n=1 Tax=Oratosquilla oratoria TaxID=337810 RepID=UPI003F768A42